MPGLNELEAAKKSTCKFLCESQTSGISGSWQQEDLTGKPTHPPCEGLRSLAGALGALISLYL